MSARRLADWLCIRGIVLLMRWLSQEEEARLLAEIHRYEQLRVLRVVGKRI